MPLAKKIWRFSPCFSLPFFHFFFLSLFFLNCFVFQIYIKRSFIESHGHLSEFKLLVIFTERKRWGERERESPKTSHEGGGVGGWYDSYG